MPSGRVILVLISLLALASMHCVSSTGPDIGKLPSLTSDDPKAEAELREAEKSAKHGKKALAQKQYRDFLHNHPEDRVVPLAQLGLGQLLLAQHQDGEAFALFSSVAEHPEPAVAEQGRFYAGVANERLGRHSEAAETLQPMVGRTIEPEQTLLLLDTLADAHVAERRYADAVRVLSTKLNEKLTDADRKQTQARIFDLVDHKASPADIRLLLEELDKKGPAFRQTAVRALRDADAAHDADRVRELVELLRAQQIPLDDELSAIALRSQRAGEANPNAVGAILSLSGRARRVGELALRGLMQAANLPPQGPAPADAPSVIFRDDAGDAARAVQAVEELATVHRVIAIIGPMDGQIAAAAGKRAQELSIPLIALTPAGEPQGAGSFVFRYFPTPDAEARALAQSAKRSGAQSFAVLYPENAYGQAMLNAFRREAEAAGMQLAAATPYAPGSTSFGAQADQLSKARFDALFVPDSAEQLALIAPALAAAGMWSGPSSERPPSGARTISLLAPSVAYHASLPRLAGRYLQGARFAVSFDAQAHDGAAHDFVARFQEAFGTPPDAFAAFAHDAYRLVRSSVEAGAINRAALADQLRSQRATDLVASGEGFSAQREASHPVEIMQLRGSGYEPEPEPKR